MFKNWKNRILNHEETPPKGVWDSIAAKMDAEDKAHLPGFVSKLNGYETTPPPAAWDNIVSALDTEAASVPGKKSKVIVLYRRLAVAASILVLVTAALFLLNRTTDKPDGIAKNIIKEQQLAAADTQLPKATGVTVPVTSGNNNIAVVQRHTTLQQPVNVVTQDNTTSNDIDPIDYAKADVSPLTTDPLANNNEKIRNSNGNVVMDLDQLGAPNTYVITSLGPNGEERRVSSKIAAYIGYLNDNTPDTEEYLDKIVKESAIWKARLKQWSDKLANTTVSPSFSNYLDVFELSNLLNDKK